MRLHFAIETLPSGKKIPLYCGEEVLLAEKAVADSVTRAEAVTVERFFNPAPVSIRYPGAEKEAVAKRTREAQDRVEGATKVKAAEVEAKRAEAKRLNLEAKKLEAELAKT